MTAIGKKMMPEIAKKVQIGTAAFAIAVAAALTPAPVAQADPVAPVPLSALGGSAGVGSAAISPDCPVGSPDCEGTAADIGAESLIPITGPGSILQNQFWWFGPPNPTPPPRTTVFTFNPLPLIPGFLQPLYGWFTQNLNFEICVFGASVKIGPYGTITGAVGRGC